jgi:ATP-dependent DNA helicase RecG
VAPNAREVMYKKIVSELKNGRQVYVICPRISGVDESDPEELAKMQMKNVTDEAKRLENNELKGFRIEVMHSKMKNDKKDRVMQDFYDHEIDVLVSTSVVEVGVNVPNATNIIIEGAERFGLAQLHQLRGRVIRGNHQAYCYILTDSESSKTIERLSALTKAKNGFELAEMDLMQRGAGVMSGTKQWGISDLAMDAIKNIKLVEAARTEAYKLVENDELKKYKLLEDLSEQYRNENHFE